MSAALSSPRESFLDVAAAAVPAIAAGWSAALLGPLAGWPPLIAAPIAGIALFIGGYAVMRAATEEPAFTAVPFDLPGEPIEPTELLLERLWDDAVAGDDVLLLDTPVDERLDALAELLLDDPLPSPPADSRVVRLFAAPPMPSAGELARRIDRHLGQEQERPDATDSLRLALDELRASLRYS